MMELKDFLLNSANYPEKPKEIKYFETHISQVFVGDEYVYKIKKPVDFGFLNFTTLKRRLYYCQREVELNSRLAKDIYLGVKKIYFDGKNFSFEKRKGAKVYEYAVYMRRIDDSKILHKLIDDGRVIGNIDKLGKTLYDFHLSAPSYYGSKYGGIKSVTFNTSENFEQVRPYIGKTIDQETYEIIKKYTDEFLRDKKNLFKDRKKSGFIKEVHGDLHSQHICMDDNIIIFDCIEFNNRFRISDVLEDLAFLLMDLEYKGRYDLSKVLKESYFSRKDILLDEDLLTFYKVYRAYVRGKIEGFISDSIENPEEKEKIIKKANDYFLLAKYYVEKNFYDFNPLIFMGVSGSGKSTVASQFRDHAVILKSDEIRKELTGLKKDEHQYVAYGKGIYSKEISEKTYDELVKRGIENLKKGRKVILDATFLNKTARLRTLDIFLKNGFNPLFVNFFARESIIKERVIKRMRDNNDTSDAHLEIVERQIKNYSSPDEIQSFRVMKVNTEENLNDIVKMIGKLL